VSNLNNSSSFLINIFDYLYIIFLKLVDKKLSKAFWKNSKTELTNGDFIKGESKTYYVILAK